MSRFSVIFLVLTSILLMLIKVVGLIIYIKKRKTFCNFFSIITIMFVFDVDMPYIFYLITGKIKVLSYYPSFDISDYTLAYILLNVAFILFCAGFFMFLSNKHCKKTYFCFNEPILKKMRRFVPVLLLLFLIGVFIDYKAAGSFDVYYRYKLLRSVELKLNYTNSLLAYCSEISDFMINPTILFCLILVQNSKKLVNKIIPLLIVVFLMLTTFSRGYVLKVACIYLIVSEGSGVSFNKTKRRVLTIGILAVVFFVGYTGVRTLMIGDLFDDNEEYTNIIIYSAEKLFVGTLGSSLVGMTRVVHFIFNEGNIMMGQSIFELSYRVIPRSIWSNKPLNYGIQTVNAVLGSPSSTMDAVSLAGELIINFHLFGLLLMPIYGVLVAKVELNRGGRIFKYCYAINIFGLATTTMWMGNTGMVSHLINVLSTYIVVSLIFKIYKIYDQNHFISVLNIDNINAFY